MAKTSVKGERVTIDDSDYLVKPAGTAQYAVFDDFGSQLGYFKVRGRAIEPEDYGVDGMHPIIQIAKLWTAANLEKPAEPGATPASKGVCRVVTHDKPAAGEAEKGRAYRAWLRKQPGCKASYYVSDPATGKGMSISIWETREQLTAARDAAPPEGAAALKSTSIEVFPLVEEP